MPIRKYDDLSPEDKKNAVYFQTGRILKDIAEGFISFKDEAIQARITKAWEDMEEMKTPWFIAERIFEDLTLKTLILEMANTSAVESIYSEGEVIVPLEMVRHHAAQSNKAVQALAANENAEETKH